MWLEDVRSRHEILELAERGGGARPPSAGRSRSASSRRRRGSPNESRECADEDLPRLRLVMSLRRLGLGPEGRMARLCLEQTAVLMACGS